MSYRVLYRILAVFFIASCPIYSGKAASITTQSVVKPALINQELSVVELHPVNIEIQSINANISVIEVGLTSMGNLDVPNNFTQAGWYKYGTIPGNIGSSVIDGHVDNGGAFPTIDGVFKHLKSVKIGDKIIVTMSNSTRIQFKVTSADVYEYNKFPSSKVFQIGMAPPTLKIITCHGSWLKTQHTYSERLVVSAELDV